MERRRLMLFSQTDSGNSSVIYNNGEYPSYIGDWVAGYKYNTSCVANNENGTLNISTSKETARAEVYSLSKINLAKYEKICFQFADDSAPCTFVPAIHWGNTPQNLYNSSTTYFRWTQVAFSGVPGAVVEWDFRTNGKNAGASYNDSRDYNICVYAGTSAVEQIAKIKKIWFE